MVFDVISIFPGFFDSILEHGLIKRAVAGGHVHIRIRDLRDFTDDRHRTVDDRPFGGGPGMVFKPEPVFRAVESLKSDSPGASFPVILLTPQGRLLKQAVVEDLSRESHLMLICGRYEGVDERVAEHLATDELSIGDYVLSGGELAAAVVMETVTRLIPGVLGNEESREQDSFAASDSTRGASAARHAAVTDDRLDHDRESMGLHRRGPLDWPHYTRPADFRGWRVPEVLLSGNHQEIRQWRRGQALLKTWKRRPDLLQRLSLTREDERLLDELNRTAGELPAR